VRRKANAERKKKKGVLYTQKEQSVDIGLK
jgi:hypothetical protein